MTEAPTCQDVSVEDFVVALNPDEDSTLPYLLRLPLTER